MKIRSKTLIILGTTFFFLILLLTLSVGQITENSFKELEEKEVSKKIDGVNAVVESRAKNLVILDLMMPEVSGSDVLNTLRNQPTTSDISIVICTAKYLEKEDEEALEGRVLGVMQKGEFSKEKLVSYIRDLYNRTR